MGRRRKNQFMSDNDSSGDSDGGRDDPDDAFDGDDPDVAAERELFRNPYGGKGKKRSRDQGDSNDALDDWGNPRPPAQQARNARGKKVDYTK